MKKTILKYYLLIKNLPYLVFSRKPTVLSADKTINEIISKKKSLARFGDGEIRMVLSKNEGIGFQKSNAELSNRLAKLLNSDQPNLLVGLPNTFRLLCQYTRDSQIFWYGFNAAYAQKFLRRLNLSKIYGDTNITRFYIASKNKNKNIIWRKIKKLKSIWENQDVLIVEGEKTKLGFGNDLFDNAKSIQRIICPSKNAYTIYDQILEKTLQVAQDKLVLIALGPTATVLAYDLTKSNVWAIDIGHIDIEYMWFLNGAASKEPVEGKAVNEIGAIEKVFAMERDDSYEKSILLKLTE